MNEIRNLHAAIDRRDREIVAYERAIEALHRLAGDTPEARAVVDELQTVLDDPWPDLP